jgi:ribosome assembly protein YihI (activator of Der GTPase)
MEPIRPVGRTDGSTPPVPAIKPLTREEREQAARERERRRRERGRDPRRGGDGPPPPAGDGIDIRA